MFKNKNPLRSKSEVVLRNIVVISLLAFNVVFVVIPVGIALVGSFHQWNPLKGQFKFLGGENYSKLFTSPLFWKSLANTAIFTAVSVFFRIVLGLALAAALYSRLVKRKSFFRTVYYMPTVTPLIAVSFVWKIMYEPQIGLINRLLGTNVNWLFNSKTALLSIIIMTIWKDFGYAVVLFLGGMYSLPKDSFEAAEIDGATSWQVFRHITLPLLKPTTLFVVITSMISYLQTYIQVMAMTQGGPGTSTYVVSYIIYDQAFVKYNFGYASAISFVMFLFIGILTFVSFRVSGRQNQPS